MEMVMPSTYRALENDEMMYLDGGGIPRDWISTGVDVAIALCGLGAAMSGTRTMGVLLAKVGRYRVADLIVKSASRVGFFISSSKALAAINVLGAVLGFSVGGAVAHLADWADGNYNGWLF